MQGGSTVETVYLSPERFWIGSMNKLQSRRFNRRQLLQSSVICSAGVVAGCGDSKPDNVKEAVASKNNSVPLRVLYVGDSENISAIERGWTSISERPLAIQNVPFRREAISSLTLPLNQAVARCDVAIVPLVALSSLQQADLVVALSDSFLEMTSERLGVLYPSVRNSAAKLGGESICLPLGARQPCFISSEAIGRLESWQAYDDLVQSWDGKVSEPTAEGWKAASYLARCSGIRDWLFRDDSLEPVLSDAAYVDALTLMVKTCNRYHFKEQSPEQVWDSVSAGDCLGGIAIPPMDVSTQSVLTIEALPGVPTNDRVLLDAFSPVVCLSASCRQTALARQFVVWLSGDDGSESVRSQVPGIGPVRMPSLISRQTEPGGSSSAYDQYLASRLSNPLAVPTLQLLKGDQYYAALDHHVGLALRGEMKPAEALAAVVSQWSGLTKEIGQNNQMRAWKRANGMSG